MLSSRNVRRAVQSASRKRSGWALLAAFTGGLLIATACARAAAQPKVTLEQVSSKVYCLCGCATTVDRCSDLHCKAKAEIEGIITQDIAKGMDEPAILRDLVNRFGVRILAAPPAKGFDLLAWVLPGVALALGLTLVVVVVRRWRRKVSSAAESDRTPPVDDKILAAVEDEMKKMDSLTR